MVNRRQRPPCPVTRTSTPDKEWIPIVGSNGWSVITRDKSIADRPSELRALKDHGVRLFAISSKETLDRFHLLEIVFCQWREIERLAKLPGPQVNTVTRTRITPVEIHQAAHKV